MTNHASEITSEDLKLIRLALCHIARFESDQIRQNPLIESPIEEGVANFWNRIKLMQRAYNFGDFIAPKEVDVSDLEIWKLSDNRGLGIETKLLFDNASKGEALYINMELIPLGNKKKLFIGGPSY